MRACPHWQAFLYAAIRRRNLCRCGCRGWCSLWVLLQMTAWSIEALAKGVWPSCRHDGSAWRDSDSERASKAGQPVQLKAAVIYIKGDWAEYAHTFAFPAWSDGLRPCWACNGSGLTCIVLPIIVRAASAGGATNLAMWRLPAGVVRCTCKLPPMLCVTV